ncbi:hypothetical protein, conserved [Babesia bigemina]|uniref:Uncharacterized protein n=1 Tax=Babesia bigemina TaxID=5866 RepID=A0A061DEJ1_BABBI|nr:hypothetical protein, conserved [Babesia bigemina]CDR97370.1 hypothetical protein, conserved [Babesia bigemina]|eukprot:XP_012769556.1 hypothetical protein, conserved [Babesia bigemina]
MQRPLEGQPAATGSAEPLSGGLNAPEPTEGEVTLRSENALVVVLDLTPVAWTGSLAPGEPRLQLCGLYSLLHRFLKTFAYMSAQSRCCVIGVHSSGTRIIYEGVLSTDWLTSCFGGDRSQDERVTALLLRIWNSILDFIDTWSASSGDPQLTTALSMGLLYLNRLRLTGAGYGRRIIIFDVSGAKDYRAQYIRLMNVAFTAAKSWILTAGQGISINTCAFRQSSVGTTVMYAHQTQRILEQLSDITNAKYLNLQKILQSEIDAENYEQSVLQLIMFWFLPSEAVSEQLSTQLPFDFSNTAVCYCHYRTVDIAFLCPCCFAGKLMPALVVTARQCTARKRTIRGSTESSVSYASE